MGVVILVGPSIALSNRTPGDIRRIVFLIKTDPIARQVRLTAGTTSLLMIGVALLYLALSPSAVEHKLPPAALLLAALLVAGIAFSPIWDQFAGQDIVFTDEPAVGQLQQMVWLEDYRGMAVFPLVDGDTWLGAMCVGFSVGSLDASARQALTTFSGLLRGILLAISLRNEVAEKAAVQRAGDLKAEFVSTVSHELRTPITTIQGFSEFLMTRSELPEKVHRHVLDAAL
jgi:signal transduction histidine kinase